MFKKGKIAVLTTGLIFMAGSAVAGDLVLSNCTACHQSDGYTIWGTIVPGSQTDNSVEVTLKT